MNPTYEIDGDVLTLYEDICFTPPGSPGFSVLVDEGCDLVTGVPKTKQTNNQQAVPTPFGKEEPHPCPACRNNELPRPDTSETITPRTSEVSPLGSLLCEPAMINGSRVYSLQMLRPTRTIKELRMRADNSHQCFITREGQRLYLTSEVLRRIDFEAIQKRRNKEKTINLPNNHQARLRVRADIFHHYHKRGIGPFNRRENVRRTHLKNKKKIKGSSKE